MKDFISPLPRLKLAAFVIALAVLGVFSFTSFTEAKTQNTGPYSALDPLLEPPATHNCPWQICTYDEKCVSEMWSYTKCARKRNGDCREVSCSNT